MALRTPNPYGNRQALLDMARVKERMAVAQEQMTTGRRITRLSDDPTGAALVLDFSASIERNAQFSKLIDSAGTYLKNSEDALDGLNNEITRLLELGQQGLSDTTGATGRANLASEVDGIRTNILAIANTQAQGKYLFAGTATTTVPFSGPAAGPITYAGNDANIGLDVGMGASVVTNLPGSTVFYGGPAATSQGTATDIFQAVTDLRDGLRTNNTAQIQTAYDNLKSSLQRVSALTTELGGRQAGISQLQDTLESYNVSLKSIRGTYQDVDYVDSYTDFSRDSIAQQASLATLSRSNKQNLFDYLG